MDEVPVRTLKALRTRHDNEAREARLMRDHEKAEYEGRVANMYDLRIRHAAGEPWPWERK